MLRNRRTLLRKTSVSAELPTRGRSVRLGGHASDESGAQRGGTLAGRALTESGQRSEDGGALVVRELVFGKNAVGRALQIGEEVGIDHRAADQFGKSLSHGVRDHIKVEGVEEGPAPR